MLAEELIEEDEEVWTQQTITYLAYISVCMMHYMMNGMMYHLV